MEQIPLSSRQKKLLRILQSQNRLMTGQELAVHLDVTPRTIRTDITVVNRLLAGSGVRVLAFHSKGYQLDSDDPQALSRLLLTGPDLQSREDRVRYLILQLALAQQPVRLADLEDYLYISKTTLEHDLQEMQTQYTIKPPHLHFFRNSAEIWAEPDEHKRRVALSRLFVENWEAHAHTGVNRWDKTLEPERFELIRQHVTDMLLQHNLLMDDYGVMDVVFAISVAYMRLLSGHPLEEIDAAPGVDPSLRDMMDALMDELEPKLSVLFNYTERENITFILQMRQTFDWKFRTRRDLLRHMRPTRSIIVTKFLEELRELYHLDLTEDDTLFVGMVRHVASLIARVRFRYERKNFILRAVKNDHPMAMEYALLFHKHFLETFEYSLGEDELSFIAAYLQLSIDRLVREQIPEGVPVAFVSHINVTCSRLMMSQISGVFGDTIHLSGPFSSYETDKIQASGASLILSTVQLPAAAFPGCTILSAALPMDRRQLTRINTALSNLRSRIVLSAPQDPPDLAQWFAPELFFPQVSAGTREEVLELLTGALEKAGAVGPDFTPAVTLRESISSTAFDCGLAIPRALRVCGERDVVAVALLARPVWWGGQKVSAVLLPVLRREHLPLMNRVLELPARLSQDKQLLAQLPGCQTLEQFADLLRTLS